MAAALNMPQFTPEDFARELQKCDNVCGPCHDKRTVARRANGKVVNEIDLSRWDMSIPQGITFAGIQLELR